MRPHLWVLRHPVVPGQAAVPPSDAILAEVDQLAGPRSGRSCWWPRTWPLRPRPVQRRPCPARTVRPRGTAIVDLVEAVAGPGRRARLLYLYPSS